MREPTQHHRSRAIVLAAMLVAACASVPPAGSPPATDGGVVPPGTPAAPKPQAPPTTSTHPTAKINLQGFPLPYRQGYTDGCASIGAVEQKDAVRFKSDDQYRTGWFDGYTLCKKR